MYHRKIVRQVGYLPEFSSESDAIYALRENTKKVLNFSNIHIF